jgi:hypothetical protein
VRAVDTVSIMCVMLQRIRKLAMYIVRPPVANLTLNEPAEQYKKKITHELCKQNHSALSEARCVRVTRLRYAVFLRRLRVGRYCNCDTR